MELNLYKNRKLELSIKGKKENNFLIFDNIIYDIENNILIREDNEFKYIMDFKNKEVNIELKDYGKSLNMDIKIIKMELNLKKHLIIYSIESDDLIENKLEILF